MITDNYDYICPICLEDLTDDIYRVKHFECNYNLHLKCYEMINKCLYCKELFNNRPNFCYTYLNVSNRDLNDSIYFDHLNDYVHKSILIAPENENINFIKFILIIVQSIIINFGIIMPNIIVIFIINQFKIINIRLPNSYPFFITIQIIIAMLYIHTIRHFMLF